MATVVQNSGKLQADNVSGTQNYTVPSNWTAGNLGVILFGGYNDRPSSATINGGSAALDVEQPASANSGSAVYSRPNLAGGNNTFSITVSAGDYITLGAVEASGVATTSHVRDVNNATSGTTAAPAIATDTTPQVGDFLACVVVPQDGQGTPQNYTAPTGYTGLWTETDFVAHEAGQGSYFVVTSAGAQTSTWGASSSIHNMVVAVYAVASAGRTVVAADTNTPTDSAVSLTNRISTASDTQTPTDSGTSFTNRISTASDTQTPTDSAVAASVLVAAASDTTTPTDSAVAGSALPATAADTNTPTDSAAATSSLVAVAADTATPTDSAVSETQRIAAAADTNTPSDSAVATIAAAGVATAADTNTPTDSAAAVSSLVAAASDTNAPTDSATAVGSLAASATDVFSATDSAASRTDRVSVAADSNAPSDSAVASVLDAGSVAADSLTLSDSAAALLDARATAADSLLFTDRAVAARPAGPGGGRAWLRAWLQEQYGKDFERYAKERRERELRAIVARTAVVPAATQRQQEAEARGPKPAPMQDRRRELFALIKTAASKPRTTEVALPPMPEVPQIQRLGPAVAAQRAPDLAPDEEAMILEVARLLKL